MLIVPHARSAVYVGDRVQQHIKEDLRCARYIKYTILVVSWRICQNQYHISPRRDLS